MKDPPFSWGSKTLRIMKRSYLSSPSSFRALNHRNLMGLSRDKMGTLQGSWNITTTSSFETWTSVYRSVRHGYTEGD